MGRQLADLAGRRSRRDCWPWPVPRPTSAGTRAGGAGASGRDRRGQMGGGEGDDDYRTWTSCTSWRPARRGPERCPSRHGHRDRHGARAPARQAMMAAGSGTRPVGGDANLRPRARGGAGAHAGAPTCATTNAGRSPGSPGLLEAQCVRPGTVSWGSATRTRSPPFIPSSAEREGFVDPCRPCGAASRRTSRGGPGPPDQTQGPAGSGDVVRRPAAAARARSRRRRCGRGPPPDSLAALSSGGYVAQGRRESARLPGWAGLRSAGSSLFRLRRAHLMPRDGGSWR
ncbi:hypothetical protein QJS66_01315 [Kocuria rhizophila]|nr:hypothetical protein QJS66_01315 [Kocuria rhizophila]